MSGWSNLSNELFRMRHNVNQTIWSSGTGRISYSGGMQEKPVFAKSAKPKKSKKLPDGKTEDLDHDAERENLKTMAVEETEKITIQEITAKEPDASAEGSVKIPESLKEAVLWAEILGDPVSVKRRKKRMNQYYGN